MNGDSRRRFLRTLALLGTAGLSGCAGLFSSSTDESDDESTQTSRMPTQTPTATLTGPSAGTPTQTAMPTETPTPSPTPTATPTATPVSTVTESAPLTAGDERDQFGRSVAIDGTTALVGTRAPSDESPPVAYLFDL